MTAAPDARMTAALSTIAALAMVDGAPAAAARDRREHHAGDVAPTVAARAGATALAVADRELDRALAAAGVTFDAAWSRAGELQTDAAADRARAYAIDAYDAAAAAAWTAYELSTAGLLSQSPRRRPPPTHVEFSSHA